MLELIDNDQYLEFYCRLSDNILFIDKINKIFTVENKRLIKSNTLATYRFIEISHIKYESAKRSRDEDGYLYQLSIISNNQEALWECYMHEVRDESCVLANMLCKVFNVKIYLEASYEHKMKCIHCGRVISKISNHCIYCGELQNA